MEMMTKSFASSRVHNTRIDTYTYWDAIIPLTIRKNMSSAAKAVTGGTRPIIQQASKHWPHTSPALIVR